MTEYWRVALRMPMGMDTRYVNRRLSSDTAMVTPMRSAMRSLTCLCHWNEYPKSPLRTMSPIQIPYWTRNGLSRP